MIGVVKVTHETKCEKHKKFTFEGCPVDIYEDITVKVPIAICAHSEVCNVDFKCMGHTIEKDPCTTEQGCSKFKIIQKMKVHIPLKFKGECDVSAGSVDFDVHSQTPA